MKNHELELMTTHAHMEDMARDKANNIAGLWHGGQASAFYSFMSSKTLTPRLALWYIHECNMDMYPDRFNPMKYGPPRDHYVALRKLKRYFLYHLWHSFGIKITEEEINGKPRPKVVDQRNPEYEIESLNEDTW